LLFQTPPLLEREVQVIAEIEAVRREFDTPLPKVRQWPGLPWRAIQAGNADDEADPETDAYGAALSFVLQLADVADFAYDEGIFRALHYLMTRHNAAKNPARWRRGAMLVARETRFADVVDYRAPNWRRVPELMAELIAALNRQDDTPALARAAMAHLNLAAIHPFLDANGRMARALHTLVLARAGIWLPAFSSIDEYLSLHRARYVKALQDTHGGAWQPERDARPWLRFCLRAHRYQAVAVQQKMRDYDRLWEELEGEAKRRGLPESAIAALAAAATGEVGMEHDDLERLVGAELLQAIAARTIAAPVPDEDPFAP
jgi:Fic family protein